MGKNKNERGIRVVRTIRIHFGGNPEGVVKNQNVMIHLLRKVSVCTIGEGIL